MFKALLFLGAGMVIHAVHSNELQDMGGLRKRLPLTHVTFLIACLAIAGIPPFAGFFSKEAILHAAHLTHPSIYWIGIITAALTAFYMFRLYFGIFWSRPDSHANEAHGHHGHEGDLFQKLPLVLLAAASVVAGFIPFGEYVGAEGKPVELHTDIAFAVLPVALSVAGILLAAMFYLRANSRPDTISASFGSFYRAARRKFYIDELYLLVTKGFLFRFVGNFAAWFDKTVIDGLVDTFGVAGETGSESVSELQSGKVQHYAAWFLAGALLLIVVFIYFH
jgi:NADH-quinone oxidoreductase subunit L